MNRRERNLADRIDRSDNREARVPVQAISHVPRRPSAVGCGASFLRGEKGPKGRKGLKGHTGRTMDYKQYAGKVGGCQT